MLVLSTPVCGGVVLGGETPGLIVLLGSSVANARIGYRIDAQVPVIRIDLLVDVITKELGIDGLLPEERDVIVRTQALLAAPATNAEEILELLQDPVMKEFLHGFPG